MYVTVLKVSVFNIVLEGTFSASVMTNGYLISWQMDIDHVMANEMLETFVHFWMWKNLFCFDFSPHLQYKVNL